MGGWGQAFTRSFVGGQCPHAIQLWRCIGVPGSRRVKFRPVAERCAVEHARQPMLPTDPVIHATANGKVWV